MYCPKCGTQNADDARICSSCGYMLPTFAPAPSGTPVEIRTSRLAIAAFVLGLLSLFTCGLTILPAVILGIAALVAMSRSGGRLTGTAFAVVGIVVPVFSIFFLPLLMGILMPALARTRQLAFRKTCEANLSGLGKAMLIYANDYQDELPRAGGRSSQWAAQTPNWLAADRRGAFDLAGDGSGGQASITASLYLLVKYAEVTPKSFVCKGDLGTTEFTIDNMPGVPPRYELIDAWDFGPPEESSKHCSYAYHLPYGRYALATSHEPGSAVAADRNPWIESVSAAAGEFSRFKPDRAPFNGTTYQGRSGNAVTHQLDGQNVLFLDTHVEFAKRAFCALDDDNIYTVSGNQTGADPLGTPPKLGSQPANPRDSLLVHDPPAGRAAGRTR